MKVNTAQFLFFFEQSIAYLSKDWRRKYGAILLKEHLQVITETIVEFLKNGNKEKERLPFFREEILPSYSIVINYIDQLMMIMQSSVNHSIIVPAFAQTTENQPFECFLILLGQRFTSASCKDQTAIPPLKETLFTSSFQPFNPQISMANRAWEKHIGRSKDTFWGQIEGNPKEKEEKMRILISRIIKEKTWWNIFFHYKHGLVYEARVQSGHGIRWNKEGTFLIGFLEPFL